MGYITERESRGEDNEQSIVERGREGERGSEGEIIGGCNERKRDGERGRECEREIIESCKEREREGESVKDK